MTSTTQTESPAATSHLSLIIILDRSGSMQGIARDMEGGVDAFIDGLRADGELEVKATVAQFDDRYELLYADEDLNHLSACRIEPRGMTALWDAVGRTVTATRARLGDPGTEGYPDRVVVLVVTDGAENASQEWTGPAVTRLVEQTQAEGWEYVFLAANVDAFDEGQRMGLRRHETVDYSPVREDVAEVMAYSSEKVRRLAKGERHDSLPDREEWRRERRRP